MANRISNFFHHLGDACACEDEISADELQQLVERDLERHKDVYDLKSDIRQIKEVIGFLGQHIKSLEASSHKDPAKVVKLEKK